MCIQWNVSCLCTHFMLNNPLCTYLKQNDPISKWKTSSANVSGHFYGYFCFVLHVQNVLIQMGLNVVSVDGMLIKRAKSYVLRCFACMK